MRKRKASARVEADSLLRFATCCWLTCLLVTTGLSVPLAQGAPLPDPVTFADCAVDALRVGGASNCTLGSTFASVSLLPFPTVVASASSPPIDASGTHGAGAQASVICSFEVIGGDPGDIVPILILANLFTTGTDPVHGIGFGEVLAHTGAAGDVLIAVCSNATCGTSGSAFSGTLSTRARSGQLGDTLLLDAAVSVGGISAEAGFASVDPLIFIDPSFPGASRYSILVSPGVGNESSSAPAREPSGLALVALGALMVWRFRPAV